jgi:Short C-terminal domain
MSMKDRMADAEAAHESRYGSTKGMSMKERRAVVKAVKATEKISLASQNDIGRLGETGTKIPVAEFAPAYRKIRLYSDGRITYQSDSGSIIGATARVESSGSKRLLQDTREVFLNIVGPNVNIAATLGSKGHLSQKGAQKFAAKVTSLAMQLSQQQAPPAPVEKPAESDVLGQITRLAEMHEKGIFTDEEFGTMKAKLMASVDRR